MEIPEFKSEDQLQAFAFQWAHNTFPQIRGLLFAVPNGKSRSKMEAIALKAMGAIPGIPDVVLMSPPTGFEFKFGKGTTSHAQNRIAEIWTGRGIAVHVITSFESFKEKLKELGYG